MPTYEERLAFFTGNFDFIDDDNEIFRKETPRLTAPKPALTDIKEEETSTKKDQEEGGVIEDTESKADDASQEPEMAQVLLINQSQGFNTMTLNNWNHIFEIF